MDSVLYRKLASTPGNLFFSPYSIAAVLAMVRAGAAGKTKDNLDQALGSTDYDALARELAERSQPPSVRLYHLHDRPRVTSDDSGFHLTVANALWRQTGYPVKPEFVERLKSGMGAEVGEADFKGAPANAARAVNAWVSRATRDKIREVLSERDIDPRTRVILANAIYFKAGWEIQFSESGTNARPFTLSSGKRVDVPTMHSFNWWSTSRDGDLQALLLPYSGKELAMLILLPDAGTLERAEKELDAERVERLIGSMKAGMTEVALPKFKVESNFLLRAPLQALGLGSMFGSGADFSGISSEPGFAVSEVLHNTFVDVNEKGTEAAAVTMARMVGSAAPPKKTAEFKADRPFLFLIRDLPTKTTLFLGRVVDPR